MPLILNIETSCKTCSVALTRDFNVEKLLEETEPMKHAVVLAPFCQEIMDDCHRRGECLDAVAVSIGPGSYTGLRIGLSMAKGICFSLGIPLIGVPTLKILAVAAMFGPNNLDGSEIFVPMVDARRMEVYAAGYDFSLNPVFGPEPVILDKDSFSDLLASHRVCFNGDGASKAREVIDSPNAIWCGPSSVSASSMLALSEKAFRERDFLDLAYSTPSYLKEYEAKVSVNKVLRN